MISNHIPVTYGHIQKKKKKKLSSKQPTHKHFDIKIYPKQLVLQCINGVSSNPVTGRTKICQLKDLILTLFGLIFRRIPSIPN